MESNRRQVARTRLRRELLRVLRPRRGGRLRRAWRGAEEARLPDQRRRPRASGGRHARSARLDIRGYVGR